MFDMEIKSIEGDRHVFDLPGLGTARRGKLLHHQMDLEAPGRGTWHVADDGIFVVHATNATDETGKTVASLINNEITYGDRKLRLEREDAKLLRSHATLHLVEDDRELARFQASIWSKNPTKATILDEEGARADPLLFMFAAYAACLMAIGSAAAGAATGGLA